MTTTPFKKMIENSSANHDGMSADEWLYTVELLNALDALDRWLWSESKGEAESTEDYLESAEQKIAKASVYIAAKNREYFQNKSLNLNELQTALSTDRDWSEMLQAGSNAAFPNLIFQEVAKIGGVFGLRKNVESLLVVAYLRHASSNTKPFLQDQQAGPKPEKSAPKEPDIIYDAGRSGLGADGLTTAITSAAKGLKTMLYDQGNATSSGDEGLDQGPQSQQSGSVGSEIKREPQDYVHPAPIKMWNAMRIFTTWDRDSVFLVDAEERHRKYPKFFHLPDLSELQPGDYVKLSSGGERFWVEIESIDGAQFKGRIDNEILEGQLNFNDRISFHRRNIFDIIKPDDPGLGQAVRAVFRRPDLSDPEYRKWLEEGEKLEDEYCRLGITDWWNQDKTPAEIAAEREQGRQSEEESR